MMKLCLNATEEIRSAAAELAECGIELSEEGLPVTVRRGPALRISLGEVATVSYVKKSQIFYALKLIADGEAAEGEIRPAFENLTYMADCSRNAVPKVETFERLVRYLAVMGYDSLGLYMEDVLPIEGYPYFGYLRTPYSEADLRRLDAYCQKFGIELVPYIQTLAHFNTLTRHYAMGHLFDTGDILLVGEEETYRFLESIIAACAKCFSTRNLNIGMDEAYMLGRGRYQDLHGSRPRFDIMTEHLMRVLSICKKYGFERPMMWSDMFFSQTMQAQYGEKLPPEVASKIPKGVELIYWDYGTTSEEVYLQNLRRHAMIGNPVGFAGGACKWHGYTPENGDSLRTCRASIAACIEEGIPRYIVTGWGDNGGECSHFAVLPTLLYCARRNYGADEAGMEEAMRSLTGLTLSEFLTIDLCNRTTDSGGIEGRNTANKYLLFNDVLLGTLDSTVPEGVSARYRRHAVRLAQTVRRGGQFSYLFKTQHALAQVLTLKADLGIRLRAAYRAKDKGALWAIQRDLRLLPHLTEEFLETFREQWERENTYGGFDVQEIRIGALKERLYSAARKLGDFLAGKTDRIPELEERLLDHLGGGEVFEPDPDQCEWRWRRMTSVNVND